MKRFNLIFALLCLGLGASAQTLTLEDCRSMAIQASNDLKQASTNIEMAGYDRKIARANYFPNIGATGMYMRSFTTIKLLSDDQSALLRKAGDAAQTAVDGTMNELYTQAGMTMEQFQQAIASNPAMAAEYMGSPMWQTIVGMVQEGLSGGMPAFNIAAPINAIGSKIADALTFDNKNIYIGMVSLQQPVFVGGKIINSNKMAALAEDLAKSQYDMEYSDLILDIDQAYWQIVSLSAKKKLAESYSDLLHQMLHDVDVSMKEGVSTKSDVLQVEVKANEADLILTKATNGLQLSKMLLCKEIGLPLDSDIVLVDENAAAVPVPQLLSAKDMDSIYADRPETRSLSYATQIYEKKADIAKADLLPQVALTARYILSNPSAVDGIRTKFGGMFSAGVMVSIPIFHGFEAQNKVRKAKSEVNIYRDQLDEARKLISLQVEQSRKLCVEAQEKLTMAQANLASAEENLRTATIGFENGVIDTNTALAAQTAWLSAHSEYIDAGIDYQIANTSLQRAEGRYTTK